jgi:23S rRNA (pseudouridine1915-N3)-methyltransferase
MRVVIHAVGRMKSGPEAELAARYFDRFAKTGAALGLTVAPIIEIPESRAPSPDQRKREEAAKPLAMQAGGAQLILLDERGEAPDSAKFARMIAVLRDNGARELVLALGGPDGHGDELRAAASTMISFGRMTWPHQIARILLAEQLYRAATILSGHPYHRQ